MHICAIYKDLCNAIQIINFLSSHDVWHILCTVICRKYCILTEYRDRKTETENHLNVHRGVCPIITTNHYAAQFNLSVFSIVISRFTDLPRKLKDP